MFWAEQASKAENSKTGKVTLVFVRSGATSANGDLTLARTIAPILSNNFPETLDKVRRRLCSKRRPQGPTPCRRHNPHAFSCLSLCVHIFFLFCVDVASLCVWV